VQPGSLAELARDLDVLVQAPVLVTGTLPPEAADLDLVAGSSEFQALVGHLEGTGFRRWRRTWVRFDTDPPLAVQLSAAAGWGSGRDHGGEELFRDARPVDGFRHLMRPGPAVQLVLVAQSLLVGRGSLPTAKRRRAEAAVQDGGVEIWHEATDIAVILQLTGPLKALRRLLEQDDWTRPRRVAEMARVLMEGSPSTLLPMVRQLAPHRTRPLLVSLSGPDGSGKSTQAARLTEALRAVGVDAASAWAPTMLRPRLPGVLQAVKQRAQQRPASPPGGPTTVLQSAAPAGGAAVPAAGAATRGRPVALRLAEHLWITSAAVSHARAMWRPVWQHRRREVLVLDRFVLDADAKLVYWYNHRRGLDITVERRLFGLLSPRADATVVLTVTPETNHARRRDEYDLEEFRAFWRIYGTLAPEVGAIDVDAGRSEAEVGSDVVATVWSRLS
jgi:thymidylate kinase